MNKIDSEQPKQETPEEIEERKNQSESLYERDKAFMQSMDEWRIREGKGGLAGF